MDSQKLENLFQLSLSVEESEREQSALLRDGFEPETNTWEIIVKYQGNIQQYASENMKIEELIAGYAIVTIEESKLEDFVALREVEYVEKPKPFYFQDITAQRESCILGVTDAAPFLTGKGVLVAILDSSIDFYNENFRKEDGSTRLMALWDQTLTPNAEQGYVSPSGFGIGVEFTREDINEALRSGSEREARERIPSVDISGHGTAVAGILAAGGTESVPYQKGVAPECDLLIVKLGSQRENAFPKTTEIMRGITYALQKAREWNMPLVINLSFGNTYGDHRGNSLLERFLDNAAEIGRTSIVVGSGNEGATGGHAEGILSEGNIQRVELSIAQYEKTLNVQLWKHFQDYFDVSLITPWGETIVLPVRLPGAYRYESRGTVFLIYIGEPQPYIMFQEFFVELQGADAGYVSEGIWTFVFTPQRIVYGGYQMFLPSGSTRNSATRFVKESPRVTLTVPSTAAKVITVGAYDMYTGGVADFSGRGYVFYQSMGNPWIRDTDYDVIQQESRNNGYIDTVKPDLAAPGVNIETVSVNGGYTTVSGTSFATPFVAGAAALLMEWGIVRGNDPYLYGEKIKAYLINGAQAIPGEEQLPNDKSGWGALCLGRSWPDR